MIDYFKTQILPSKIAQLILQTGINWHRDNCMEMGAALSYYALFSLFPLCLISLSILGLFIGPNTDNYLYLLNLAKNALPQQTYYLIMETLINLNASSVGAGLIGFLLLLLTASKIFEALTRSLNQIWKVDTIHAPQLGLKARAIAFIREKFLAFLMVLSSVLILLLSFLSNLAIAIILVVANHFQNLFPWLKLDDLELIKHLQFTTSYLTIALVVIVIFKILPSTRMYWRDIWLGSILTTLLLMLLQNAVSSGVIKIGENFQAYGVIGNVMVLLLWNFLIFQIFFLGCELNYVYAHIFGSKKKVPLL